MRRKVKKILSVTLVAMMVTGLVAGCSGGSDKKSSSGGDEQVTLRFSWWGGDERNMKKNIRMLRLKQSTVATMDIRKNYLRHLQEKQRRILFRWDPDGCQVM